MPTEYGTQRTAEANVSRENGPFDFMTTKMNVFLFLVLFDVSFLLG